MFSTAFFIDPVERLHMIFMTQMSPSMPAGTTWRVVGHRDVVQSNSRLPGHGTAERLHAIQMIEIDSAVLSPGVPIVEMSV